MDYLEDEENKDADDTTVAGSMVLIEPDAPPELRPKSTYKSIKGDDVDSAFAALVNSLNFNLPLIRLGPGKYLIGTETKMIVIKNSTCMVRVGGGFERLEEYLARNHDSEMEKIKRMMRE